MPKKQRIWGTLDPFVESGPVMGRKVANTGFLRALLQADRFDAYHWFLPGRSAEGPLRKYLANLVPDFLEDGRIKLLSRRDLPEMLATTDYHCFHLSDCIVSQQFMARMRNRYSQRIFPVTGLIHSLSYAKYPADFLKHLWPGTTRRDAIVCTSRGGQQAVQSYFDCLRDGFCLSTESHPAPTLHRIPLAVNAESLVPGAPREGGPVRLLVFGRISHTSKMDLVPLLRALHRLAQDGMDPASVELVLAGWNDNTSSGLLNTLQNLASNAGIKLTIKQRPSNAEKRELFQSSDIFVSIADNPQETFGITLAEAGAFGLPVVASDYDGYKDIVVDGETGLLVETIGPDATPDIDTLAPLSFDSEYHLSLAQRTAVSIPALADALGRLIESPDLRRSMGQAARKRVEEQFTWSVVIDQYVSLWDDLWDEPVDAAPLRDVPHPLAPDFGRVFCHYTSHTLSDDTMLQTGRVGEAYYRGKDFPNLYAGLHGAIDLELAKKLAFFGRNPVDTATLIRKASEIAPHLDVTQIKNHILWALKQDILQKVT